MDLHASCCILCEWSEANEDQSQQYPLPSILVMFNNS